MKSIQDPVSVNPTCRFVKSVASHLLEMLLFQCVAAAVGVCFPSATGVARGNMGVQEGPRQGSLGQRVPRGAWGGAQDIGSGCLLLRGGAAGLQARGVRWVVMRV